MAFVNVGAASSLFVERGSASVCSTARVSAGPAPLQMAHHVQFKNIKKANHRRPKKHRLSDINRAPVKYSTDALRDTEGLPPVMTIVPKQQ